MDQATFDKMFAASMNKYRSDLRDNDSGSWSQEARDFAIREGLFAGNGTCAIDGQPNMMWEDFLTRAQAAQLLYRLVLGKIVTKSTIENCGADGEGIKYAAAKAAGFTTTNQEGSEESPAI